MNVEIGARYRLRESVGEGGTDEPGEGIALVSAPFPAGAEATVDEIVPADVDGAGSHDEDSVVLDFGGRRWSCTEAQLAYYFEAI